MKRNSTICIIAVLAPLALAKQPQEFIITDHKGADLTVARGINDRGDIVGSYQDASGYHGFLLSGGQWSEIAISDAIAVRVRPTAINASGDIAGQYIDPLGRWHGFLVTAGVAGTVEPPGVTGAQYSGWYGINAQGDVVGTFSDSNNILHTYMLRDGVFTQLPDAIPGAPWTEATGINAGGDMVGMYYAPGDPKMYGYVVIKGVFTKLDIASATTMVCGFKINDRGDVVGHYFDTSLHGFLYRNGVYTTLDFPNGVGMESLGLNNRGDIVGDYTDSTGKVHGYLMPRAAR